MVALLYRLDLMVPSFKTMFFFKFVTISLLVKVLLSISFNISTFLDLLIGIMIFKTFFKFSVFSKVNFIIWSWLKLLELFLLNISEIFCMSILSTDKLFKTLASVSPCFILYSMFCILYSVICILYSAFCILYSIFCIILSSVLYIKSKKIKKYIEGLASTWNQEEMRASPKKSDFLFGSSSVLRIGFGLHYY